MQMIKGGSPTGLNEALEDAINQAPRTGNEPWSYEITKSWVEDGGVVGRMYYVEVRVTP